MRSVIVMMALTLAGCAAHSPLTQQDAERHAANVQAARRVGYAVVSGRDGSTLYCAPAAETGSHLVSGCLNQTAWERKQVDLDSGPSTSAQTLSGRPSDSGTLGR
jgi:hypothetical protein